MSRGYSTRLPDPKWKASFSSTAEATLPSRSPSSLNRPSRTNLVGRADRWSVGFFEIRRRVPPDRRRPRALLDHIVDQRIRVAARAVAAPCGRRLARTVRVIERVHPVGLAEARAPAAGGVFEDANVVEGRRSGIERWVRP